MRYLEILEAKVDQGKSKLEKIRARTQRKLEPGDPLAAKEKSGPKGDAARNPEIRRGRLTQASRDEMSSRLRGRVAKSVAGIRDKARRLVGRMS
jgi:hypothetical protein